MLYKSDLCLLSAPGCLCVYINLGLSSHFTEDSSQEQSEDIYSGKMISRKDFMGIMLWSVSSCHPLSKQELMNEENSNQSVVENYWAVKLWVMRPDRAQRKVFWWFCLFSSISKSKRALCLGQRPEEGESPLTADAATPGDTEPVICCVTGVAARCSDIFLNVSDFLFQPFNFLSWPAIKLHSLHFNIETHAWPMINDYLESSHY